MISLFSFFCFISRPAYEHLHQYFFFFLLGGGRRPGGSSAGFHPTLVKVGIYSVHSRAHPYIYSTYSTNISGAAELGKSRKKKKKKKN